VAEPEPARACYAKKRYTTLEHAEGEPCPWCAFPDVEIEIWSTGHHPCRRCRKAIRGNYPVCDTCAAEQAVDDPAEQRKQIRWLRGARLKHRGVSLYRAASAPRATTEGT
jgi:hypothetical protein